MLFSDHYRALWWLVHWPLMGWPLHLVQWTGPGRHVTQMGVTLKPRLERPTQLNSTEQSELQSWPSFRLATWCQHQYQYHLLNYWRNVWRVQKCTWKWSCWKERLFRVAADMDIHGYIHVWIPDLGLAVDASTDVWYKCLISDTGLRINDFTICVWVGDAEILLLLRMF